MKISKFGRIVFVGLALFAGAAIASAETIQLRNGSMLAGAVRLEGTDSVIVDATFPKVATFTLKREELAPESLYGVLERRTDPKDAAKRRDLAELADRSGLKGAAIAEYRAVRQLDPSSAKDLDPRIARLIEGIAADILQDARDLLEDDNGQAALMYLHTILEDYPDTKAAKEAKSLMQQTHKTVAEAAVVAVKTVAEKDAPGLLDKIAQHLADGDGKFQAARGHESSSVSDQRSAERAIAHYEKAWEAAKQLPVSVTVPDLKTRIETARDKSKSRLVDAYLTAGTIHLQRRSISSAERYCNKACLLDPENKPNHELHGLILRAKAFGDWGVPVLR